MSKFLKRNKNDLKNNIMSKLGLTNEEEQVDRQYLQQDDIGQHLEKALRDTQKKKIGIKQLVSSSNPTFDFSEQLAQLKWRIQTFREFSQKDQNKIINTKGSSLTGKPETNFVPYTFEEMYENQKKKFSELRQRRRTKITDPKYIQMVGNMQMRRERRKQNAKQKLQSQMKELDLQIEDDQI